jgi:predicted AAA+ superfamily ATPase
MSLFESSEGNASVSIGGLFENEDDGVYSNYLQLEDIAYLICRGGWPQTTFLQGEIALDQAFDYVDSVVERDIQRVDDVERNADRARRLLRSYARNIAQQVSLKTIQTDIMTNDTATLNEDTIADYIKALKRLYVIEDLEAWNPNLRSKAAIRTSDTRHLVDPSIGTAVLGIGPKDLMNDLESFGLFFENMAVRDLRVYAEALDGRLYHYRDSDGLECDAVLHRRNGSYGLIEIKLGGETKIAEAVNTLNKLEGKIDTTRMPNPAFKMVVTAVGKYAYRRKEDGVYIVPIGCLKP